MTDESPGAEPRSSRIHTAVLVLVAVLLVVAVGTGAELLALRSGKPKPTALTTGIKPSVEAYRGLGTWVDIFDKRAWSDPPAAVADMASHGVRTLYLQTGNSHSATAFKDETATATFIREAHARDIRVVAWYLPYLKSETLDLDRVTQALRFRTADGQAFDGFALDIESAAVKPENKRIAALRSLTLGIRAAAGAAYPLGAIIPSPVGLARKSGYWDAFPYTAIARGYDVILPMSYYTFHAKGDAAVYADSTENIRILRAQPGCATVPVHLIGGMANKSTATETASFARAVHDTKCIGVSLYEWAGTSAGDWKALGTVAP